MVRLEPRILEAGCIGREGARNDGAEALVESQLAFCAQKPRSPVKTWPIPVCLPGGDDLGEQSVGRFALNKTQRVPQAADYCEGAFGFKLNLPIRAAPNHCSLNRAAKSAQQPMNSREMLQWPLKATMCNWVQRPSPGQRASTGAPQAISRLAATSTWSLRDGPSAQHKITYCCLVPALRLVKSRGGTLAECFPSVCRGVRQRRRHARRAPGVQQSK